MKVALGQIRELDDETARFARQLGIEWVQFNTPLIDSSSGYWTYEALSELKAGCDHYGLVLKALENVPSSFMTDIMTGGPDRDRQLLNYCTTIENLGRVGIPILGHHFMPTGVWRTDLSYPGRGGALVSAFDAARLSTGNALAAGGGDVAITEEELWANYEIFLRTTLPVAERAGVRLALHPDDPPVRTIGPTARLFYSVENLRRAYELSDGSHAWGLDLCLGTVSEMAGGAEAVREAVEIFGPAQAICYIHLRQVIGTVPRFAECFLGEGSYSPREIVSLLADSGFDGFFLDDHVPRVAGDSPWGHRSHAYALGYIQALLSEFESPR